MPSPKSTKVFVSYAHADGVDLAQRLVRDLSAVDLEPWLDLQRLYGGAIWTKEIEEALDNAEIVLAILTNGSYTSEICRAEQLRSLRKGKCVIPLLAQAGADIPLHLEPKQHLNFDSKSDYYEQFDELLKSILTRDGALLSAEYRSTYVTAPPLPVNYVERPTELAALRNALIADGGGRHVALTALQGMGGIGKTIMAQAICADDVIQQAFPDGVIWVTIGREPSDDPVARMREIGKVLNDDLSRYDTVQGSIHQYRTTIRSKAALVVLDDVWDAQDVEPFRADSLRSRLLFTTRDSSIAATVGAREFTANLLTTEQSYEFLAQWSGGSASALPPQAGDLIRECGRLPLALSMIGAMLRGKTPAYWEGVLDLLRSADLRRIKAQFPNYAHPNLFNAIQVSVDELEPRVRGLYIALAVLLDDMPAPLPVLQTLWNATEFDALETAEYLVSRSLASQAGNLGTISLHDLQLDYVRAQSTLHDALPLIHGALRLSAHIIFPDAHQFASQLRGRLLPYQNDLTISDFLSAITKSAPRPWLCCMHPGLSPPGGALIRTLAGHAGSVTGVALSADGQRAISASADDTVKVWDLATGREMRTLVGHTNRVTAVAMSLDGRRAASGSRDKTLRIWDVDTGQELRSFRGHAYWVTGVALSADGRRAISASGDKTLRVWDVATGQEMLSLTGHSDSVTSVALSADGRRAVSASDDKTLKVWDTDTGREVHSLPGHSDSVNAVALSRDGRRAVSASDDRTLKAWNIDAGREVRSLVGHADSVTAVALSAEGRRAISASQDKTLRVWNLESREEIRSLVGHSEEINGVALSADGRYAVSASKDRTLKVWDLETSGEIRRLEEGHSDSISAVVVSADGQSAVSGSKDKTLKVWNLATGREVCTLLGHSAPVTGVALSVDGLRAVSSSWDKTLRLWNLDTGRELRRLVGHSDYVTVVALSADGRRAVSGSEDGTIKVWDLDTGAEVRSFEGHSGPVNGLALTVNGLLALSASGDSTIKIWDLETGRETTLNEGHSAAFTGVALSADSRLAVSASGINSIKIWDLETRAVIQTFGAEHTGRVNSVALAPEGSIVVSASEDKTIKAWDIGTGRVTTFTCDAAARCACFGSASTIVAGDSFGRIHFLSLMSVSRI